MITSGKGMSNGELIVRPPAVMNSDFIAAKNSIVGNTCLYGATGGKLFVNGRAGERSSAFETPDQPRSLKGSAITAANI